jgi:hypothetical protein
MIQKLGMKLSQEVKSKEMESIFVTKQEMTIARNEQTKSLQ